MMRIRRVIGIRGSDQLLGLLEAERICTHVEGGVDGGVKRGNGNSCPPNPISYERHSFV